MIKFFSCEKPTSTKRHDAMKEAIRNTLQFILPPAKLVNETAGYDVYPTFPLQQGMVYRGFETFAEQISLHSTVIMDGYTGVLWKDLRTRLDKALQNQGIQAAWVDVSLAFRAPEQVEEMVEPFLGGNDPLFGTRANLQLIDFFDQDKLKNLAPVHSSTLTIFYGTGAFLSEISGFNIYIDLPKNEIQYRSRAGCITNLACTEPGDPKKMYKRFYFVDWIVLNRHKGNFINTIGIFADLQRPDDITWAFGESIRATLDLMAVNFFRVRPWFEPGAWGGNWIREHITGLCDDVLNYAWSFELIVPENGLLLEGTDAMIEISFDWLMYRAASQVLGESYRQFGNEFPIRFDFLDTFRGGNLSVQCHPRLDYMKTQFGEDFTQEETYYILDSEDDAGVYLGFQENIDPLEFRNSLEMSFRDSVPLDIEKYVQRLPSKKHDLFLIPPGTIHGSGINNLVLEISSTPYLFTFKLYDWLRPDLDGKPRQLNISRGMDNLCFDRCGDKITNDFISKPVLLDKGADWELWHLPTHAGHLYDVHRFEFDHEISVETGGKCHILSLVEGSEVILQTASGMTQKFCYAETFVIPAAANTYKITNKSPFRAKLIKAFVK